MTDKDDSPEPPTESETVEPGSESLGAFIRAQRELANLSLRQLSGMAEISNAYLSQIERNLHEPSMRVLKNVGAALGLEPEMLLTQAGLLTEEPDGVKDLDDAMSVERAVLGDPYLSDGEKHALLSVYRSYRAAKD